MFSFLKLYLGPDNSYAAHLAVLISLHLNYNTYLFNVSMFIKISDWHNGLKDIKLTYLRNYHMVHTINYNTHDISIAIILLFVMIKN